MRTLAPLALAGLLIVAGCSTATRDYSADLALKSIGLPAYPHANAIGPARETTASSFLGATRTTTVVLVTRDDFGLVKKFYEERLPATKREIVLPMGKMSDVTLQFFDKTGQKQVVVMTIKGVTVIDLQSTSLGAAAPSPSPSG